MKPSHILILILSILIAGWFNVLNYLLIGLVVSFVSFIIYAYIHERKVIKLRMELEESLRLMLPKYNDAFPYMSDGNIWFNLVNGYMYDDGEEKEKYFRNSEKVYIADPLYVYLSSQLIDGMIKVGEYYDWTKVSTLKEDMEEIKANFKRLIARNIGVTLDHNNCYSFGGRLEMPKKYKMEK